MGDGDDPLWEHIKKQTTPLSSTKKRYSVPPKPTTSETVSQANRPKESVPSHKKPTLMPTTPVVAEIGAVSHLDGRSAKRFKRGNMDIEFRIDLHGYTKEQAYDALVATIERAYEQKKRSGLVITGKGIRADGGVGVIKQSLPIWLRTPRLASKVLAVHKASPRDGGEGAVYVLLKRQ